MHALSVKQPYAEAIASGAKVREYRTWAPRSIVGNDLLIVAPQTPGPGYADEPRGVAVCVVRVTKIVETRSGYAWCLEEPRRVAPLPVKGYAALYKVDDASLTFDAGGRPLRGPASRAKAPAKKKHAAPAAKPRAKRGPYSFAIGDRTIRGERATTPAKARARAAALAKQHGCTITILRDGLAVSSS